MFTPPRYASSPIPAAPIRHRVVVVGAGMVGLTAALDLARRGVAVVVVDDDDTVSVGSRAICHAQRSLEIYGRLGLGARLLERGVTWNVGRVFFGDAQVFAFDLLPEAGHAYPAFVNLQQYYLEAWLVEACLATGLVELRWKHRVVAVSNRSDGVVLGMETPDGAYDLAADWVLACDGARSFVRESLGLASSEKIFRDRFLIADVVMQAAFPPERWFWFDPPFHQGGSTLLHRQADDVWRIDFQIGWDADPELERDPARVTARLRAMLGPEVDFALEWVSIYTFRCRRLETFRHGRLFFLGDAAHQVSPFGARGGNGGAQDADNLGWKLAAFLNGEADESLLDSYDAERVVAADENILASTRSTDFITPKNAAARAYRDAVLELASVYPFARPLVDSGRLSRPAHLAASPLNTADVDAWTGGVAPGSPAVDAPVRDGWLLEHLNGGFTLLLFGAEQEFPAIALHGIAAVHLTAEGDPSGIADCDGLVALRYAATHGNAILFRPDQHVAGRWRRFDPASVAAARRRALGHRDD